MTFLEMRRSANSVIEDLRIPFNTEVLPAILADRLEPVSEQTGKEIDAGKRIDLRIPRFLAVSGKGGPGHEEWSNVTLFDHASSVGMAAATFAALDLLGGGHSLDEARSAAALALAVGLLHDVDKLLKIGWNAVTVEAVCRIFIRYRIGEFLNYFGVRTSPEQFAVLVSFDEVRTAYRAVGPRMPDSWINIVRRYVRFADVLDSEWLRGLPTTTMYQVVKEWQAATGREGRLLNPSVFISYRPLLISDPHHPFLLAKFAIELDERCERLTGMRPLLHAVRDETLVSLLPADDFDAVIAAAVEGTLDALSFDSTLIISPAGIPKIGGAKPTLTTLRRIVESGIPTGEARRLLSVKTIDFQKHETALRELAGGAGCPFVSTDKPTAGQTMPIIRSVQREDAEFSTVERACLVSLSMGVEGDTRAKEFDRKAREYQILSLLGPEVPGWLNETDALTRRTGLALITAARMEMQPQLAERVERLFTGWFAADGIFADRGDRGTQIRQAVRERLFALAHGRSIEAPEAEQHCLITGEPVEGPPIDSTDGLHGINSSALSYRPGRAEQKFRETAETYVSLVSQAEYRLRAAAFAKLTHTDGGIPVRLSSPTAGGVFSLSIGEMSDRGEFGLFDMVRSNRDKRVYEGLETYQTRTHLGRFESLPKHFADRSDGKSVMPGRISFFRVAMQAAYRYGRPLHLFSGLPHPRREFFYCDCLDPELRVLLGQEGWRIEDLPDAMQKLELVGIIAGPPKNNGLGMADTAKSFCLPATRFCAACLAWVRARDRDSKASLGQVQATLHHYIECEVEKMDQENTVAPPVRLGRMAATIQRRPGRDASAKDETFLIDMAVEGALYAYKNGWRDRDGLVAQVAGRIDVDGGRRADGVKGFYSAKTTRQADQSIGDAIQAFAEAFIDSVWLGTFKGRPPSSSDLRNFMAAYRWTFARSAPQAPASTDEPLSSAP